MPQRQYANACGSWYLSCRSAGLHLGVGHKLAAKLLKSLREGRHLGDRRREHHASVAALSVSRGLSWHAVVITSLTEAQRFAAHVRRAGWRRLGAGRVRGSYSVREAHGRSLVNIGPLGSIIYIEEIGAQNNHRRI